MIVLSVSNLTVCSFVFVAVVRNLQRNKLKSGGTRIVDESISNTFQCEAFSVHFHCPRAGIGHTAM